MKAMLFAAGLGTRLRPITDTVPKPLLPVVDRSVVEHQLEALARAGVREVVINLHHLGNAIVSRVGDGRRWNMAVHYSPEDHLLGTGGGLARARRWLDDDGEFLVVNGDVFHRIDLADAVRHHRARGAAATLVTCPHPGDATINWIGVDDAGDVVRVPEMEDSGTAKRMMFTGLHVLTPTIFDDLDPVPSCILRCGYRRMLERGLRVATFATPADAHYDIGTPPGLVAANLAALDGAGLPSWIDPSARIASTAVLGPSVVVGKSAQVGEECRLDHCVVLPGAIVAPGTIGSQTVIY